MRLAAPLDAKRSFEDTAMGTKLILFYAYEVYLKAKKINYDEYNGQIYLKKFLKYKKMAFCNHGVTGRGYTVT